MSRTVFWLQLGACGGDSMALLNIEAPNFVELLSQLDLEVLWHPSLSNDSAKNRQSLISAIKNGEQVLDILVVEGSVIRGPGGTGMYDTENGQPKKDLLAELAKRARYVVAAGTCASFGGIGADGDIEATGLQFAAQKRGGFLGKSFVSAAGAPVINLPGCPCHGDVLADTFGHLCANTVPALDQYQSPLEWYGLLVHQGCVRNEYHEYRVEERQFGERGCLFFYLGCRGPIAYGPCNKVLWNRRSSKTRVGVPCLGCTQP
ncbi:MAG: NADH:ubiquinone oxidoreductase, partial [Myxococcota bacterium]|nr:NADH:ubiquinone oxidoreductase [Myxococcota bacterium]